MEQVNKSHLIKKTSCILSTHTHTHALYWRSWNWKIFHRFRKHLVKCRAYSKMRCRAVLLYIECKRKIAFFDNCQIEHYTLLQRKVSTRYNKLKVFYRIKVEEKKIHLSLSLSVSKFFRVSLIPFGASPRKSENTSCSLAPTWFRCWGSPGDDRLSTSASPPHTFALYRMFTRRERERERRSFACATRRRQPEKLEDTGSAWIFH